MKVDLSGRSTVASPESAAQVSKLIILVKVDLLIKVIIQVKVDLEARSS